MLSSVYFEWPFFKQTPDEYIFMKNIGKPAQGYGNNRRDSHSSSGVSKFDRYKNQDEDMDDGNYAFLEHINL